MRKHLALFLIVSILLSLYGFPLSVARAEEPNYRKIEGYDFSNIPELNLPDWPTFWGLFNNYALWDLEWFNGSDWVSVKEDLQIVRDYPIPNKAKLTLIFDASHQGDYRLTFAINRIVKDYVTKLESYIYQLTYDNYSLIFDWSDAAEINGINFNHGIKDDYFWFRMSRDNVPLGAHVEIDPEIIVEYDLDNVDGALAMGDLHPSTSTRRSAASQSFQTPAIDHILCAVDLKLRIWVGSPTGNATVQIFAHSGTYGSSSLPTGSALAVSDPLNVSTLTTSMETIRFTFTGANQITLVNSTYYCVAYVNPTSGLIDASNQILVGTDGSSPSAPGNMGYYENGAWIVFSTRDMPFEIYGLGSPEIEDVTATTAFSANSYGWVNVTAIDRYGVDNLDAVTLYVNTTGSAQNFTLQWNQTTGSFTEVSDPNGIVEISGSVRENQDAFTDLIAFRFKLSGTVAEGDCDARVIVLNDDTNNDTEEYSGLFTYTGVEWDPIGDLIDSAFSLFGIADYMSQAIGFVTNISQHFTDSITALVILINLQFQIIWNIWGWFADWATRIISGTISFFTVVWNITTGVATGAENIWVYFNFSNIMDAVPLFVILYWIDTIYKRGKTQGYTAVLWGDLQNMINLSAFFMGAFASIIGYIEGKISWLFQALT